MTVPISGQPAPKHPSGRQWPIIIIALLGLNIGVCVVTIAAATANPARIEPGYYDKAINWDAQRGIVPPPAAPDAAPRSPIDLQTPGSPHPGDETDAPSP